jgi:hypothetical protein
LERELIQLALHRANSKSAFVQRPGLDLEFSIKGFHTRCFHQSLPDQMVTRLLARNNRVVDDPQ